MTQREFALWEAYNRIAPIGDERADIHQAVTCHTVAASAGAKNVKTEDFMPFRHRVQPANDVEAALLRWAETHGTDGT